MTPPVKKAPMRYVSADMLQAGQDAFLAAAGMRRAGAPLDPFRLPKALTAAYRAMSQAGFGRDKTCAERTRRYRARLMAAGKTRSR